MRAVRRVRGQPSAMKTRRCGYSVGIGARRGYRHAASHAEANRSSLSAKVGATVEIVEEVSRILGSLCRAGGCHQGANDLHGLAAGEDFSRAWNLVSARTVEEVRQEGDIAVLRQPFSYFDENGAHSKRIHIDDYCWPWASTVRRNHMGRAIAVPGGDGDLLM